MPKAEKALAEIIVDNILRVLSGRGGFDHWWDDIDYDIQKDIGKELRKSVLKDLKKYETMGEKTKR